MWHTLFCVIPGTMSIGSTMTVDSSCAVLRPSQPSSVRSWYNTAQARAGDFTKMSVCSGGGHLGTRCQWKATSFRKEIACRSDLLVCCSLFSLSRRGSHFVPFPYSSLKTKQEDVRNKKVTRTQAEWSLGLEWGCHLSFPELRRLCIVYQ